MWPTSSSSAASVKPGRPSWRPARDLELSGSAVVIPVYNVDGTYLARAIESALNQTRPFDEIFVVDDCSTDDSPAVTRGYDATLLRTPRNLGPAAARNLGIRQSRSDLIFMLDADDYFEPRHNEVLSSLLAEFPEAGWAAARCRQLGDVEWLTEIVVPDRRPIDALLPLFRHNMIPESAVAARRGALLEVGGYDESFRYGEDYDLWLRLAQRFPLVCTSEVTSNYRIHALQRSNAFTKMNRGAWRAQQRALEYVKTHRSAEDGRRAGLMLRDMWADNLDEAWAHRDREALEYLLTLHDVVPASAELYEHWSRRVRYGWLPWGIATRAWRAVPVWAKPRLRRLLRRLRGSPFKVVPPGRSVADLVSVAVPVTPADRKGSERPK